MSGGLNDFDAPLELPPGGQLALPVFAGLYAADGFGAMSRSWHQYELAHVLSRTGRRGGSPSFPPPASGEHPAPLPPVRPVLYNSWEATTFAVNEDGQARLAELAAGIGVELFVVDDGWFMGRGDDRAGLGDWTVDPSKFPAGLSALIRRVKRLGMGFGIWIEPEMVNPDSDLYRRHPDWVYHFANRSLTERRHQLVLNLAREDVADFVFTTLDGLLSEHPIDFVKWDMNRHFSEPGWPGQVGHNPERAWVGHVEHVYTILDRIHTAHPHVQFESCSGGGGRVDLGILSPRRRGLDLGQHRRLGPRPDPGGVLLRPRRPGHDGVGNRQPQPPHGTPAAAQLPVPRRHGRFSWHRRGFGGVVENRARRSKIACGNVQIGPSRRPVRELYRLASTRRGPLGAVQIREPGTTPRSSCGLLGRTPLPPLAALPSSTWPRLHRSLPQRSDRRRIPRLGTARPRRPPAPMGSISGACACASAVPARHAWTRPAPG